MAEKLNIEVGKGMDWEVLRRVAEYAYGIIWQAPEFKEFAIACVEHLGPACIPMIKPIYSFLLSSPDDLPKNKMTSYEDYSHIGFEIIEEWFNEYQEELRKREVEKEFKENIDELQFLVREYRNSDEFKDMLNFVGSFKWLAPYNAMLVRMQLPGALLVLNGKNWAYYNRRPKPNAQCLITLKNFGPVQCMFDYSDTELIPGCRDIPVNDIMDSIDKSLIRATGTPGQKLAMLQSNLPAIGVYLDDNFTAAHTYGGYIKPYSGKQLKVTGKKGFSVNIPSAFLVSVNNAADEASRFKTLCHELGHLFCKHVYYDTDKKRRLTVAQEEFEAETVAWIICKRLGISNPSEAYLADYVVDDKIPICSTEMIMKAAMRLEELMSGVVDIKKWPYYKYNKEVRRIVDKELQRIKNESRAAMPKSLFPDLK